MRRLPDFIFFQKFIKDYIIYQGSQFTSNCEYYTEIISEFLDFHLQPIGKKVKSYIKDTNDFLKRLCLLTNLLDNSLLCTMDLVSFYPNIPHDKRLFPLRKRLDERDEKDVSTDTLVELAELVLKNNIFNFNQITLKPPTVFYLWQN